MANQMKNLHFRGIQLFQILCQGENLMVPRKKAAYADLLE
jgi:hypothetical protein